MPSIVDESLVAKHLESSGRSEMNRTHPQVTECIASFQLSVSQYIKFLAVDHEFTQSDPIVRDLTSPRDASVSITFDRPDLRITIGLSLFGSELGITIRDNNLLNKTTHSSGKRRVKVVYFEYLVEFLTNGETQPIVPHYGDGPARRTHTVRRLIGLGC